MNGLGPVSFDTASISSTNVGSNWGGTPAYDSINSIDKTQNAETQKIFKKRKPKKTKTSTTQTIQNQQYHHDLEPSTKNFLNHKNLSPGTLIMIMMNRLIINNQQFMSETATILQTTHSKLQEARKVHHKTTEVNDIEIEIIEENSGIIGDAAKNIIYGTIGAIQGGMTISSNGLRSRRGVIAGLGLLLPSVISMVGSLGASAVELSRDWGTKATGYTGKIFEFSKSYLYNWSSTIAKWGPMFSELSGIRMGTGLGSIGTLANYGKTFIKTMTTNTLVERFVGNTVETNYQKNTEGQIEAKKIEQTTDIEILRKTFERQLKTLDSSMKMLEEKEKDLATIKKMKNATTNSLFAAW